MNRWQQMCEYKCRIAHEAFRANTLSGPPSRASFDETTRLGQQLGWRTWLAMCIPESIARRDRRSS